MNPDLKVNVVLFVATSDELEQLRFAARLLGLPFEERHDENVGDFYSLGVLGFNRVIAARTRTGSHDYGGSCSQALLFQTHSTARAFVQLGMAFGVNSQLQKVGQVLVATSLFPYDRRDVSVQDGQFVYGYQYTKRRLCKESLRRMFQRAAEQLNIPYKVHFGMMLSGGARIYSVEFRNRLLQWVPQKAGHHIVGGEMEGVGLLAASNPDDPSWIVVKGISDFAEHYLPEHPARPVACRRAALFVLRALLANPVPIE